MPLQEAFSSRPDANTLPATPPLVTPRHIAVAITVFSIAD